MIAAPHEVPARPMQNAAPHARAREYRERHRAYGVLVPCAEVPAHLINGWRIVCDAEDITDVVVMRWPQAAPHEVPARQMQNAAPPAAQNGAA